MLLIYIHFPNLQLGNYQKLPKHNLVIV
jgi:hypothetical protein